MRQFYSLMDTKRDGCANGVTRLGINYVFTPHDVRDSSRVDALSKAAFEHNVAFVCNTPFGTTDLSLKEKAREYVRDKQSHSTSVNIVSLGMEQCQMGAGATLTVGAYGNIGQCPYFSPRDDLKHNGSLLSSSGDILFEKLDLAVKGLNREYNCILRETH